MTIRLSATILAWLAISCDTGRAEPPTLWRIAFADGSTVDADAKLRLYPDGDVGDSQKRHPAATILEILAGGTPRPDWPRGPQVALAGGDRFAGRLLGFDGTRARLQSARIDALVLTIPLSRLSLVWFEPPPEGSQLHEPRWDFLDAPRKRDIAILKNGERIDGTLRDMEADNLRIVEDDNKPRERTVPRADIRLIAFNTELSRNRKLLEPHAILALRDGSRLTVTSPTLADGRFTGSTTWKQLIAFDAADIASIRPENRGRVYLHDLEPSAYVYTPFLSESIAWRNGLNSQLQPLRLREPVGVSTFERGIGMHSRSTLTFDIGKKYARFDCLVGLDAIDGRGGDAEIVVRLDGAEIAGTRRALRSGESAHRFSVPVVGGSKLTLEVLHGKGGPVRDAVNWCNAVLIP